MNMILIMMECYHLMVLRAYDDRNEGTYNLNVTLIVEILVHQSRNEKKELKSGEAKQTPLASVPLLEEGDTLALEYHPLNVNVTRISDAYYSTPKLKKRLVGLEDDVDFYPGREGINFNKGVREKRHGSSWYSRSRSHDTGHSYYKDRSLNATAYKEMIDSYLKNANRTLTKEDPPVIDQWKKIGNFDQKKEAEIPQRG
ncbi:hypothetical protein glysoja_031890 [Glycine soja]|uniref:Uncharacterized protein n=1 Tax=Glycine soja TaxID=3848 RepID=A0A0B2P684_GLYSO|nr:hypothetical protein glysoja_031890 [Glycine soja]